VTDQQPRDLTRRSFLAGAGVALLAASGCTADALPASASASPEVTGRELSRRWRVPGEHVAHTRTWMAWPSSWAIWGSWLPGVQNDIALIARTIARYEPVVMCATDAAAARKARRWCGRRVTVIDSIPVDDCWMRDSGPVFRRARDGSLGALSLGFNGWGGRQAHAKDALVAQRIARRVGARLEQAEVVGEGGGIECDGAGTLFATESCWVNDNRNPGKTRDQIEAELLAEYGAEKFVWMPGVRGRDITDGHVDATSRFVKPGLAVVQVPPRGRDDVWAKDARQQLRILSRARDARGKGIDIIEVAGPREVRSDRRGFLDSYVNFAVTNGAIVTAQFGDRDRDRAARRALREAFPGREVVQLNVDRLHKGGGGIHCVTQQQPRTQR
jgi:agmatine deiminase